MGDGENGVNGVGVWEGVTLWRPCRRQNSGFGSGVTCLAQTPGYIVGGVQLGFREGRSKEGRYKEKSDKQKRAGKAGKLCLILRR